MDRGGLYEAGGSVMWATLQKSPDSPADSPSLQQVMAFADLMTPGPALADGKPGMAQIIFPI